MPDLTPALQQEIEDYVDYLMSGPAGLGQNFSGVSAYVPAYLTGTIRTPYTVPITTTPPPQLTVDPIVITNITVLDINAEGQSRYIQVDFTPQAAPPFILGGNVYIENVIESAGEGFNGDYGRAVVYCTNSTVILQTRLFYTWATYISGGDISKYSVNRLLNTDTFGTVTVTGPTDIVFVSSQTTLDFTYTCTTASEWDIVVQINRYRGFPAVDPLDSELVFEFDGTISEQSIHYSESTSGSASAGQNIFTTVLDSPSFGLYRYFVEIAFYNYDRVTDTYYPGDAVPNTMTVGLRSLTAQVIKQ
jgi:hypothetical protein